MKSILVFVPVFTIAYLLLVSFVLPTVGLGSSNPFWKDSITGFAAATTLAIVFSWYKKKYADNRAA